MFKKKKGRTFFFFFLIASFLTNQKQEQELPWLAPFSSPPQVCFFPPQPVARLYTSVNILVMTRGRKCAPQCLFSHPSNRAELTSITPSPRTDGGEKRRKADRVQTRSLADSPHPPSLSPSLAFSRVQQLSLSLSLTRRKIDWVISLFLHDACSLARVLRGNGEVRPA